ncbi:hypothetical protein CF65_02378 [Aggregatibacter actinomycetemcomitans HK1651]|nr:hypothetical protein CF65_02378 [Aggregatibacter actinomycetemcomitans HK1651]
MPSGRDVEKEEIFCESNMSFLIRRTKKVRWKNTMNFHRTFYHD